MIALLMWIALGVLSALVVGVGLLVLGLSIDLYNSRKRGPE